MTVAPPASTVIGMTKRTQRVTSNRFFIVVSLPALVVVAAVILVPLIVSVYLSFTDYNISIPDRLPFIGLANYRDILSDPAVPGVVVNTLEYVIGAVVLETVIGLGIAVLLARRFRGARFFRVIYMLPLLVSWVPVALTWRALLDPEAGWIGGTLAAVGLPSPSFVGSPTLAMPTVVATDMWVGVPFMAVLLLTAVLSLNKDPAEAALVDGASQWQIFRYVTLPGIRPVLVIAVVFRTVDAFRQFAVVQLMTGGGPGDRTTVLNYYTYLTTFQFGRVGYGAALSVVMVLMMIIVVSALFMFGGRR